MESIKEVKTLNQELIDYLKMVREHRGYNAMKDVCNKILNLEYISDFDKYSKDILALSLEKSIMLTLQSRNKFFWNNAKIDEPLVLSDEHDLKNSINIFARDLYKPFEKNEITKEIHKFYDLHILEESKKIKNKLIKLPSGRNISVNDIMKSIDNTLEQKGLMKLEYYVENTKKNIYKAKYVGALVASLTVAMFSNKNLENEIIKEPVTIEVQNPINNELNTEEISNEPSYVTVKEFVGYDNACSIEDQKIIYEIAHKEEYKDLDNFYNILMTIADNESNGKFDSNNKISATNDYGFMQINASNLSFIERELGYTKDQILSDVYCNVDASAYLVSLIYDLYEEDVKNGNYENIIGAYNGWTSWKHKPSSVNYVNVAMEKLNNTYNKSEEELYNEVLEEVNNGKQR